MLITAAVLRDRDATHTLEAVQLADPGPDEVLVHVSGAGVCHTDTMPRHHDLFGAPPVILGHEGSGIVAAIGSNVAGITVGDHVIASFDSCGECANCLAAHPAYCATFMPRNLLGRALDGSTPACDANGQDVGARWFGQSSFATHALVAARNLVVVDQDVPVELLGPLGCGVQTGAASVFNAFGVRPGESLAVFGVGSVGLSAVMAARVAGATTIIAVDRHEPRLALATELGATHTFTANHPGLTEVITAITAGGVHYALDTTGVVEVITTAINTVRPTGTCGMVAPNQGDVVITPNTLAFGRTLTGIFEGDAVPRLMIPQLITLWRQGRFPFDRLITTYPLERINEAEQAMVRGEVVKPVLIPATTSAATDTR